jgi:hypothetical protein
MGNIGRKLRETPIILEPFPDEAPAEPDAVPEPAAEPQPEPAHAGSWLRLRLATASAIDGWQVPSR